MDRVEQFVLSGSTHGNYRQYIRAMASSDGYIDVHLNLEGGPTEVPDFMLGKTIDYALGGVETISYILARQPNGMRTQRRLVRGAFSDFNRAYSYGGISEVTMSNGTQYYGLPGAIFDSHFNLLMLMSSKIDIRRNEEDRVIAYILQHICRLSPAVFQRQDNIIEKTIIKKVIPFCASHEITPYEYPCIPDCYDCTEVTGKTISVFIDDAINEKFIRRIVPPRISDFTEENIHKILVRNAKEILDDNR